jgi:hypothetical protein
MPCRHAQLAGLESVMNKNLLSLMLAIAVLLSARTVNAADGLAYRQSSQSGIKAIGPAR